MPDVRGIRRAALFARGLDPETTRDLPWHKLGMGKRRIPESERIACHEAGHAVVAHYLGYQIGDATIIPDRDGGARARILIAQESRTVHERFIPPLGDTTPSP